MENRTSAAKATSLSLALIDLQGVLGDRVTTSQSEREHHSSGESYHAPALPDMVCFPRTTNEVSAVLCISKKHQVPVIPFGAGTSVEGQISAVYGGITVDLREMNKVLRVCPEDRDVTVEAGVTRLQLNRSLKGTGLTFFVDPGADATIGGMTATRASGTTAVRYGTMRENVLALTVVLADGKTIKTGSRAPKSSSGYDLTHLFVGSEGTLGIITEITLRLHTLPEAVAAAVCAFPTIEDAVCTAIECMQLGIAVARIEFLDDKQIDAINRFSGTALPALPTLLFEFHGMNDGDVSGQSLAVEALAEQHRGLGFNWKKSQTDRDALWKVRHDAYYASLALVPDGKVLTTDVCVPISRLAECIALAKSDLDTLSFPGTILGHVGDGNFHVLCVLDPTQPQQLSEASAFAERLVGVALKMDGTCTGEHGVGCGKLKYLEQEHGEALTVLRMLKTAMDPEDRMNPGKMIPLSHKEDPLPANS